MTQFSDLPDTLPVFPLSGALLLPQGDLPLNIFEPRYLAMVDDALRSNRLIGMIQNAPSGHQKPQKHGLYTIGCAGRITSFSETDDGRYLINLHGVCRFVLEDELDSLRGYRRFQIRWNDFKPDTGPQDAYFKDRASLIGRLKTYFEAQGMDCNWRVVNQTPDERLITLLSMICPFSIEDKQALLEAESPCKRADILFALLALETGLDSTSQNNHPRH